MACGVPTWAAEGSFEMATMVYTAIIEKERERGLYAALCPELDVASQGATVGTRSVSHPSRARVPRGEPPWKPHRHAAPRHLLPLRPARVHGVGPAFEVAVPALIPCVALLKTHFGARQRRADALTGQRVVLGLCLAHPAVVAVRFRCRRVDFPPGDVAPMTVLIGVYPHLIRVLPEHPCTLGVGRCTRGEQGERDEQQGRSCASPRSDVARKLRTRTPASPISGMGTFGGGWLAEV